LSRKSKLRSALAGVDAGQCHAMSLSAIVQIAFDELRFLLVSMGCMCSEQTQFRQATVKVK